MHGSNTNKFLIALIGAASLSIGYWLVVGGQSQPSFNKMLNRHIEFRTSQRTSDAEYVNQLQAAHAREVKRLVQRSQLLPFDSPDKVAALKISLPSETVNSSTAFAIYDLPQLCDIGYYSLSGYCQGSGLVGCINVYVYEGDSHWGLFDSIPVDPTPSRTYFHRLGPSSLLRLIPTGDRIKVEARLARPLKSRSRVSSECKNSSGVLQVESISLYGVPAHD